MNDEINKQFDKLKLLCGGFDKLQEIALCTDISKGEVKLFTKLANKLENDITDCLDVVHKSINVRLRNGGKNDIN